MKLWFGLWLGLCVVCDVVQAEPYQGLLGEFSNSHPSAPLDEYLVVASFSRAEDARSFISRIQVESLYPLSLDQVESTSGSCFHVLSGPHLDYEFFVVDSFKALGVHNARWKNRKQTSPAEFGYLEKACSEKIDLLEEYLKNDYIVDDRHAVDVLIESTTELLKNAEHELEELRIPVKPPQK